MASSIFANTELVEEAWRWQGGTSSYDDVTFDGALVDQDGNLFLVGMVSMVYRDGDLSGMCMG